MTGDAIKAYVAAAASPTVAFTDGRPVTPTDAPSIAGFSSRGPSLATGDQLKPDIAAPGVDVLAAVSPAGHNGRLWDLESGTSMSSPHIAGLSLLIKQKHPDWTPDMIKSAMMTTAYDLKSGADPFAEGAGQVDPTKFLDPGLVYPSGGFNQYLGFICGVVGDSVSASCPQVKIRANELNLPSISVSGLTGLQVSVSPSSFTLQPGQAQKYAVAFTQVSAAFNAYANGFITLTGDKSHVVRIPVVAQPVKLAAPAEVTAPSATTGSLTYQVKSGFAGTMGRTIRGIQVATKFEKVNGDSACAFDTTKPDDAVKAGIATVDSFTTPANARFIRFQTFQSDSSASVHDLDMYVYRAAPGSDTYSLVLTSGGPDANEVTSSTSAGSLTAGAKFKVYIHGCGVDAGGGSFTLFAWALTTTPSDPWTTPPATSAVTVGQTLDEAYSWSNLPAGNRYLARVTYDDGTAAIAATNIELSTR